MTTKRPLALVTGASSGIGAAFARRLARDGYDLVVAARRRDRLEELASGLPGTTVEIVQADLGTDEGIARVCGRAADRELALLVNNAGLAHYMPLVELPEAKADELMKVNVVAPTLIARSALPGMVARNSGALVNVASLLAFSGAIDNPMLPKRAIYAATRAYIVVFSQILASEVAGSGIRIQALCPGIVRTEFHTRQGMDTTGRPRLEAEQVVTASLAGLAQGELVCVPTLEDVGAVARLNQAAVGIFGAVQQAKLAARYADA
jgi:short-subunit dehydrogenase